MWKHVFVYARETFKSSLWTNILKILTQAIMWRVVDIYWQWNNLKCFFNSRDDDYVDCKKSLVLVFAVNWYISTFFKGQKWKKTSENIKEVTICAYLLGLVEASWLHNHAGLVNTNLAEVIAINNYLSQLRLECD